MLTKHHFSLAACLLLASTSVFAGGVPYQQCFNAAAAKHGVPVDVLVSIAEQESGFNPKAINGANKNGSTDYGIMQINSWWLPRLAKYGVHKAADLYDPCTNIEIGAWIFAQGIKTHGWNWRGIGAYNAATDSKRLNYAEKILKRWVRRASQADTARAG